jgi:hypothetical protein
VTRFYNISDEDISGQMEFFQAINLTLSHFHVIARSASDEAISTKTKGLLRYARNDRKKFISHLLV